MRKNPGRKDRRRSMRERRKGDLNRKSTYKMRTNMGMKTTGGIDEGL